MIHSFFTDLGGKSAAYALLRYAYGAVYGGKLPKIEKTAFGKPYFPQRSDVHFSLSHGKTHSLVCLGDVPCGCDIEHERAVRPETISRFVGADELSFLPFLTLWTLKESYIKLNGNPALEIKDIRFTAEDGIISPPEDDITAAVFREDSAYIAILSRNAEIREPIFISSSQLTLEIL